MSESTATPPDAVIELRKDDAYLREYHAEWGAALKRRLSRIFTRLVGVIGLGLCLFFVSTEEMTYFRPALILFFGGVAAEAIRFWSRAKWLSHVRKLDGFGKQFRLVVRGGRILQTEPELPEPVRWRIATVTRSPRGYFLSFQREPDSEQRPFGVSNSTDSIYLPHRAIRPQMSREEFLGLIDEIELERQ